MGRSELFRTIERLLKTADSRSAETAPLITRREVLKKSIQVGMALPFSSAILKTALADSITPLPTHHSSSPVIIIGGGTAGLTAAYRLMNAGVACEIFEANTRFGGRMYTQPNFNGDGMFCERGGELVDQSHEALMNLCAELELEIESLKENKPDLSNELFYINGRYYNDQNLLEAFAPLARRIRQAKREIYGHVSPGRTPRANPWKFAHYDRMTLAEFLDSLRRDVDGWVIDLVSVAYVGEMGLEANQQSALNLILLISSDAGHPSIMGPSDEGARIKGGNGSLPDALVKKISARVPLHPGHEWVAVREKNQGLLLTFKSGSSTVEIQASQVICAIPFTLLRRVDGIFDLPLSPNKKLSIAELGYGTNSKIMLGYRSRIWRNTRTDGKFSNGSVYTNLSSQQFWETSRGQCGTSGIITNFIGGNAGLLAGAGSIDQSAQDFNHLFSGAIDLRDGRKTLHNWATAKYSLGSYICPKPGQYARIVGATSGEELGGRLQFCGEHTSEAFSGFMNGAVDSGNRVAGKVVERTGRKLPVNSSVGSG